MHRLLWAALLLIASGIAQSQQYPNKPIRFIVPFPPGGGVDIVARAVGEKLSPRLSQSIIIDNKPGAGTTIGFGMAARSAPDGYTLIIGPIGSQAIVHHMLPKRGYDVHRDFAPIARIGFGTVAFIVPQSSPAKSVKEFVAL